MSLDEFTLETQTASGASGGTFTRAVSFTLTRERYTPFAVLDFTFDTGTVTDAQAKEIVSVRLKQGPVGIFFGRTAGIAVKKSGGRRLVSGRAVSFTKTLATSDAIPGMMYGCTLSDITSANTQMPNVYYQQISDSANYIYVKQSDTIWSAIAALSIKLYEQYPYITGMNTVYIKKPSLPERDYSDETIVSTTEGNNFNNAVSKIYMQGTQDTYDYYCEDSEVIRRGIIRERYISLDRQWLSSPALGLKHKLYFSRRGGVYRGFTYYGFKNEQLCEGVYYYHGGESYSGEVSKLILRADRRGVFTTVISYDDGYSLIVNR